MSAGSLRRMPDGSWASSANVKAVCPDSKGSSDTYIHYSTGGFAVVRDATTDEVVEALRAPIDGEEALND